jgi:NADH-quinone oxidoreductase subunit L
VLYAVAALTAMLTAFYMFRLLFITFSGKFRGTEEQAHHLHESPPAMTIPLVVLAILSVIGGFVGIPELFVKSGDRIGEFLSPVIAPKVGGHIAHSTEYTLMAIATGLAVLAIIFAWFRFKDYKRTEATGFAKLLENKWYVDELYDSIVVRPLRWLGGALNAVVEKNVIDGIVNGVGRAVSYGSRQLRLLQSGQVGSYVLLMVLSMLVVFALQFFLRK